MADLQIQQEQKLQLLSLTTLFSKDRFINIIIRYIIKSIATEVKRASHTHHVPHIGFPQRDPVIKQIMVKVAPIGAIAELTIKLNGVLKAIPIIL